MSSRLGSIGTLFHLLYKLGNIYSVRQRFIFTKKLLIRGEFYSDNFIISLKRKEMQVKVRM